ncbi:MAG: leucine-rich repeat protein [Ruminococcus sp.]|nr:leucine-rich repeat protein [Ruminococcus sp.]
MGSPNTKLLTPENGKLTPFKKAVAVCTSAAIAGVFLHSFPVKMRSYAEAVTGETANGFTYSIEGEKVSITGWTGDKETVTSLNIPATVDGQAVNAIGSDAFAKYPELTSVSIPDTVTELGWGAFASSGLTSITLPAGIQKLSYRVFMDCQDLKELTLPKDFPKDGMSCSSFYGMGTITSLSNSCIETIIFEDGLEEIPDYCAYSAPALNKLVIPDSVTDIGSYAFCNCDSLTELDLPSSIKTIEWGAYEGCDGLKDIVIPEGVETVQTAAFNTCANLTSIVFPSTLKELGKEQFAGDAALTSVTLPEGLEKIGLYAFQDCKSLKEITIPSTVTSAGSSLEKSYIETVHIADGMEKLPDSLCSATNYVSSIEIPDSVTSLGSRLFANAKGIKEFTVPAQITEGKDIFNGSSLESVSFEAGLTKIPHDFFYYADSLVDINWTSDITEIEYRAFNSCKALETADIPNTVKAIGDSAFSYCDSLKSIHIPENGCKIGAYIFSGCNSLEEAYVPSGLYGEGSEATYYLLYNCASLKSVTFAEGVTAIPQACCRACEALTEVRLPEGLEEIGYQAFKNCKSLGSVTIPDSVTLIRREAFEFCESLNEVKLPAALTEVGSYAFHDCSSLRELSFPKTLTTIGDDTFKCGLREVWFEDGIEVIPENALANARELEIVHIPGSVTKFGNNAFYNCYELRELDMPFEAGELIPSEHFDKYTFYGCNSLFDERVVPYKGDNTFVNRIKMESAEGGLLNYTIYYSLNPVFKDIFKYAKINVYTKDGNPILARSRPEGLTDAELEGIYMYRTTFTIDDGKDIGVFRFSTEPKELADTTAEVYMAVGYTNSYKEYEKLIPVNNDSKGWEPVSFTAPQNIKVEDGKASFDVYGSAPIDSDVTIYLNGEAVATATPNQYTGRFSTAVTADADYGDTLELYAQSGEKKSEISKVYCNSYTNDVVKVEFYHFNNHKEYKTDITGAFKYGQKPCLAINPANNLGFEVTLADNDCEKVYVSSTTNGNTSMIELKYNEETGTWKGSGKFDTHIIGTLNILAVPRDKDMKFTIATDSDGNSTIANEAGKPLDIKGCLEDDKLGITALLNDYPMEIVANEENIAAYKLVPKYADAAKAVQAAPPDLVPLSRYSAIKEHDSYFSDVPSINVVIGRTDYLTIDGKEISGNDLIADDSLKLEQIPIKIQQPDGTYIEVYQRSFTDSMKEFIDTMSGCISFEAQCAKEFLELTGSDIKEGCITVYRNVTTGVCEICYQFYSAATDMLPGLLQDAAAAFGGAVIGIGSYFLNTIMQLLNLDNKLIELEAILNMAKASKDWLLAGGTWGSMFLRILLVAAAIVVGGFLLVFGIVCGVPALDAIFVGLIVAFWTLIFNVGLDMLDKYLERRAIANFKRKEYSVSNDANVSTLIDPSGIAYEWLPSNPVEGVTAEIYYQNDKGKAVKWNAEDYDQVNPQITDSAGWFAWDVPEGMWQVRVSGEGYEEAQSEWLPVLPVQTDVNIKLTSTLPAEIADAGYSGGKAMVKFTKHMLDESITDSSLILTDKNGKAIACDIAPYKEEGNDTEASLTFILTPKTETSLSDAKIAVKSGALSYAGVACANSKGIALRAMSDEEMPQQPTTNYSLGDVNDDGMVDAKDASMILVEYSKASTGAESGFNESQKLAGEVNGDGKIDAKDASAILAYYAMASTATGDVPSLKEYMTAKAA